MLSPRPEKGFEFSRLFDHFGPRFRASDHVVLHHVSAEGTSASCCIAINNNLNMKARNSNVVQLSVIVQLL